MYISGQYQIRIACTFISQCNRSGIPNSGHINLIILCTVTICNPFRISNISRICCLDINSVCIKNLVFDWCLFSDDGTQVFLTTYNQLKDGATYTVTDGQSTYDFTASVGRPVSLRVVTTEVTVGKYSRLDFHLCTCLGPDRKISCFHKIFGISGIYSRYLVCCHLCNSGHGSCDSNNLLSETTLFPAMDGNGNDVSSMITKTGAFTPAKEGTYTITVQAKAGNKVVSDSKVITVATSMTGVNAPVFVIMEETSFPFPSIAVQTLVLMAFAGVIRNRN